MYKGTKKTESRFYQQVQVQVQAHGYDDDDDDDDDEIIITIYVYCIFYSCRRDFENAAAPFAPLHRTLPPVKMFG
jgi:hypothetical protein